MKKIYIITLLFLSGCKKYGNSAAPDLHCDGLPGCSGSGTSQNIVDYISNFIALLIQYVGVVAVISVMISGIMYILSTGEEEKVNRAKKWVTWSLIGVFLSVMAWYIINALNNISLIG